jgi:hypothetical protein
MASRKMKPTRSMICIMDSITEKINTFNYLEYSISYKRAINVNVKTVNFVKIIRNYEPDLQTVISFYRHTRIQIYKTTACCWPGFNPRSGHVDYVVNKMTLRQLSSQVLEFPLPILIPSTAP